MSDGDERADASLDDPRWRDGTATDGEPEGSRPSTGTATADNGPPDDDPGPVELGVALLSRLEHEELSVADALDRIEAFTTSPDRQREILATAERRGLIDREGGMIRPTGEVGGGYVSFEREVVVRRGEYTCRRCGADLGEGHFVRLDPGEAGPYGSSCVRKVLGRE